MLKIWESYWKYDKTYYFDFNDFDVPKVSISFIVHNEQVLPYSSLRKISAEVDCENSNPCPRKFYKVDLQREIAELNPDTSTVILVFDSELQKEELVNDYDLFQFLADSGGAMGKSIIFIID